MAAISFVGKAMKALAQRIRTATAQANTGQTDWVPVPPGATTATVVLRVSAVAGTTPIATLSLKAPLPGTPTDDTGAYALEKAALTGITGAATLTVTLGQDIVDDTTTAATGVSDAGINKALPPALGLALTLDRTTGDETYTYTLDVLFQ